MNQLAAVSLQFIVQAGLSQHVDPIIHDTGEDWILIGIGGLTILVSLIIGCFNRCLGDAIFFSLAVSLIVIVLALIV